MGTGGGGGEAWNLRRGTIGGEVNGGEGSLLMVGRGGNLLLIGGADGFYVQVW